MNLKVVSLTAVAVATLTAPAIAHHSFAMFDAEQTITYQGTVKEFEWRNPHSWLRVMVNDEKTGKPVMWALELSSPARLVTMGMRADSVKEGDAVGDVSSDEGWHAWWAVHPGGTPGRKAGHSRQCPRRKSKSVRREFSTPPVPAKCLK
jgi:hypothetical protein